LTSKIARIESIQAIKGHCEHYGVVTK